MLNGLSSDIKAVDIGLNSDRLWRGCACFLEPTSVLVFESGIPESGADEARCWAP